MIRLVTLTNSILIILLSSPNSVQSWSINNFMITGGHVTLPFLETIQLGVQIGLKECQNQFKWSLWNCPSSVFTNLLNPSKRHRLRPTREAAFMHSIMNAGIVHTITTTCQTGQHSNCTCSMDKKTLDNQGAIDNFSWKGCSDALKFAIRVTREFLDKKEGSDTWASINIHNNQVGRQIVQRTMKKVCRCHGVSGSCALKSCWLKINEFRVIGKKLKLAYRMAKKVEPQNMERPEDDDEDEDDFESYHQQTDINNTFYMTNLARSGINGYPGNNVYSNHASSPNSAASSSLSNSAKSDDNFRLFKTSLIYSEESPNYCFPNATLGSVGTLGRQCSEPSSSNDPSGEDEERASCKKLCRKCGFTVKRVLEKGNYNCNCTFKWCCKVHCELCPTKVIPICSVAS